MSALPSGRDPKPFATFKMDGPTLDQIDKLAVIFRKATGSDISRSEIIRLAMHHAWKTQSVSLTRAHRDTFFVPIICSNCGDRQNLALEIDTPWEFICDQCAITGIPEEG